MDLEEALRKAFRDSGWSVRRLSKEADLAYSTAWLFANGAKVRSDTVAAVAKALGLELRPIGKSKGKARKSR